MAILYAFGAFNLFTWDFYLSQGADATLLLDQDPDAALRLDDLGGFTLDAPTYDDVIFQPTSLNRYDWFIGGTEFNYTVEGEISGTVEGFYEYFFESLTWFIEGISLPLVDFAEASRTISTSDDQKLIALMFSGDDDFYLSAGDDIVRTFAGDDYVYGDAGRDVLFGNAGDDEMVGGLGDDNIYGGTGNDFLEGGFGSDEIYGGAGDDILYGSMIYDDTELEDSLFAWEVAEDAQLSIDLLFGGTGNDFYVIDGLSNHPLIFEELDEGIDTVLSDLSFYYMPENIEYYVNDGVNFDGFTDNGTFVVGNDLANLIKTTSLFAETIEDLINLDDGSWVSDEYFYGEAGNDTLRSGAGNDYLDGGTSDDLLEAGDGDDSLFGGSGNDILNDGTGTDTIDGGDGIDTLLRELSADYTEFTFTAVIDLVQGKFYSVGFPDPYDTIISIENVSMLGTFDHQITGTDGANLLSAGSGSDMIEGGGGSDTVNGGAGTDTLLGGNGNDFINGGTGRDRLTGDSGVDQFVFRSVSESSASASSADVITDFVRGTDKINLSAIDAFASTATNNAFVWRGTSSFSNTTAGEVRYQKYDNSGTSNDYTMVFIDNDADTTVEMSIRVNGLHNFTSSDFIL